MNEEIWVNIIGYEGLYLVSDRGRIKSLARIKHNGHGNYVQKGRVLTSHVRGKGYLCVTLTNYNKERRTVSVHRIAVHSFSGDDGGGLEVRHIDGDPKNNNYSNLCYGTHRENMEDMVKHGNSTYGERSSSAKLTDSDVRDILSMKGSCTQKKIAEKFNVSAPHVSRIFSGKYWSHISKSMDIGLE